jgi:Ser/Thr protein kinase RdoA (MazF antagonist)
MNLSDLLAPLNTYYPVKIERLLLYRQMIGQVYIASGASGLLILKVYRSFHSENALSAIEIIQYLHSQGFPVPAIIPTRTGETHIRIATPEGSAVAVLFEFVEGTEPVVECEIGRFGQQVGWLHRLMRDYPGTLIRRGKAFYIDRFITVLRKLAYDSQRVDHLSAYGEELWSRMERLPVGFCHGDLHSGNMLQPGRKQPFTLVDFDVASQAYAIIDAAALCDASDFNQYEESAYAGTVHLIERFHPGYRKECSLSDLELSCIPDFIAIRHYELIATITECQGLDSLSVSFLDEQYDWLMRWCEVCERRRSIWSSPLS